MATFDRIMSAILVDHGIYIEDERYPAEFHETVIKGHSGTDTAWQLRNRWFAKRKREAGMPYPQLRALVRRACVAEQRPFIFFKYLHGTDKQFSCRLVVPRQKRTEMFLSPLLLEGSTSHDAVSFHYNRPLSEPLLAMSVSDRKATFLTRREGFLEGIIERVRTNADMRKQMGLPREVTT
jgi:hypothetical protein